MGLLKLLKHLLDWIKKNERLGESDRKVVCVEYMCGRKIFLKNLLKWSQLIPR